MRNLPAGAAEIRVSSVKPSEPHLAEQAWGGAHHAAGASAALSPWAPLSLSPVEGQLWGRSVSPAGISTRQSTSKAPNTHLLNRWVVRGQLLINLKLHVPP